MSTDCGVALDDTKASPAKKRVKISVPEAAKGGRRGRKKRDVSSSD